MVYSNNWTLYVDKNHSVLLADTYTVDTNPLKSEPLPSLNFILDWLHRIKCQCINNYTNIPKPADSNKCRMTLHSPPASTTKVQPGRFLFRPFQPLPLYWCINKHSLYNHHHLLHIRWNNNNNAIKRKEKQRNTIASFTYELRPK